MKGTRSKLDWPRQNCAGSTVYRSRPAIAGRRSTGKWTAEKQRSGEAEKLKQLEDENRKLKHLVAELRLDNRPPKDVPSKNW